MDQNFMKEKKVLPLVLSMSLPMMLSMLINSLYNIIDSMFVAHDTVADQGIPAFWHIGVAGWSGIVVRT